VANAMLTLLEKSTPPDMAQSQIASLKKELERGSGGVLSSEKEQAPFMMYLLGSDYTQISDQCGWPVNTILLTAIKNQWYEKKQMLQFTEEKQSAHHVLKSAVNTMLATTTAVIMKEMQQIMKGELAAANCKYIPKDIYGLEKFISVVNQLHKITETDKDKGHVQNVHVNIANLPTAQADKIKELPPTLTVEEYIAIPREQRLKMLMPNVKKDY
jgi:hypothetical protein